MPLMEITVVPIGTKGSSVSRYVAGVIKLLKNEKRIEYEINPMGTVVQADSLDELMDIAKKMHRAVLKDGAKRVVTNIKIDERTDKKLTMKGKLNSLKSNLNEHNKKK